MAYQKMLFVSTEFSFLYQAATGTSKDHFAHIKSEK